MLSLYIGVYRALYDYAAQSDEELSINADDLLYLLEKSDVDDWWKVKKRVIPNGDEEVDEPAGLVPSNYIEEAPIVNQATPLYDYDKQTEEEISFKEGDRFNIFDMNDPDWFLVGDVHTNQLFGYVPANYLEIDSGEVQQQQQAQSQPQIPSEGQQMSHMSLANFSSPPIHRDRSIRASPQSQPQFQPPPMHPSQVHNTNEHEIEVPQEEDIIGNDVKEDGPPPPMPSRPEDETPVRSQKKRLPTQYDQENEENIDDEKGHMFDGEYFTWYIDEVDGRKKRAVIFSIGQGNVILKPNASNPKKLKLKSASTLDQQWRIKNLTDFSHEKKHLFLELKNPSASIELHTGSKDVAEAITSILGDLKGAENAKGLREVARASQASTGGSSKKIGKLMYDFEAQGADELMIREGDEVYIVNESKSKDWWMCENIETGKQGVIPSSYIEIIGTSNLEKLTQSPQRMKSTRSTRSSKGRVVENDGGGHRKSKNHHHRSREERNKIREHDRMQRDKTRDNEANDKSTPNFHRVRTWIDSSGTFKVEAEFLGCVEGKIHLHKTNGVKIAVAATKLCLEDLEYVEKITGTSLEEYKQEVSKQMVKRTKSQKSGVTQSATSTINDIAPPQPTRPKTTTALSTSEPEYDWFEFFLSCGVDLGNCQRYTLNFNREQMDEKILADINPSLLRTLGLREGDILRVMKFLDNKFDRKKSSVGEPSSSVGEPSSSAGGLFTEPTGALKNNNSAAEVFKVDPKALPSPLRSEEQVAAQQTHTNKFEDDAWAVKPAARSSEDVSKPPAPQQPQYTGSLQDLVNIKPLELNKTIPSTAVAQQPQQPQLDQKPTAPTLTPVKTGNGVSSQPTAGLVPVQQTGALIPAQPTGFMPITAQPTGFFPIQATGVLQPQLTFGMVPLQTGSNTFAGQVPGQQKTGGTNFPQTTFGQPAFQPLQTGNVTMPQTSFGQAPIMTGQVTGGMSSTSFGGQPLSLQRTGPLVPAQRTGGQSTGGLMSQPSFGQPYNAGMLPQTSFGMQHPPNMFQPMGGQVTGGNSFASYGGQTTGGFQPTNNMSQQFSFGGQAAGGFQPINNNMQQQPSFGQPQMMPQSSFGAPQQQPAFNQFQQQPNMNQLSNMFQNTGINGSNAFNQPHAQFPNTTFGQQPQFQPLQSQPTGAGFGNAPTALQNQPTGGRRANLQAATPDNPFGF